MHLHSYIFKPDLLPSSSTPRWNECKQTVQRHEVTTVSKPQSDMFSLFLRTEPKYLPWHQPEGLYYTHTSAAPHVSNYQSFFHDTRHACQKRERTSSAAGGDSLLSSGLFQLSLFFRDQGHFHLKMVQFKHFMPRARLNSFSFQKAAGELTQLLIPFAASQNMPEAGGCQSLLPVRSQVSSSPRDGSPQTARPSGVYLEQHRPCNAPKSSPRTAGGLPHLPGCPS